MAMNTIIMEDTDFQYKRGEGGFAKFFNFDSAMTEWSCLNISAKSKPNYKKTLACLSGAWMGWNHEKS